jgi:hypothetical protein
MNKNIQVLHLPKDSVVITMEELGKLIDNTPKWLKPEEIKVPGRYLVREVDGLYCADKITADLLPLSPSYPTTLPSDMYYGPIPDCEVGV